MIGPYDIRLSVLADEARVRPSHVFHILAALSDPAFDPRAFATFARLELAHIERMLTALRSSGLMPEPKRRRVTPVQHATRLPAVLQLPDDWLAYAQTKRQWDRATTEDVLADFIEHWTNRTDARAAKIDWKKTWETWVRRDRRPNGNWQPPGSTRCRSPEEDIAFWRSIGRDWEADEIERGLRRA